jgi:hypothetical protein
MQRKTHTANIFGKNWPTRRAQTPPFTHVPSCAPYLAVVHIHLPGDIKHLVTIKYSNEWKAAICSDLKSSHDKSTFRMDNLPVGHHTIGSKWIFNVKSKPDDSVDRFKACFAAQSFSQRPGVDYSHTFTPAVKISTLRTNLAFAASHGMHAHSADIETAFLNADLQEEIFMRQPNGAHGGTPKVMCLLQIVYGLKHASREWYSLFNYTLTSIGLTRSTSDASACSMNLLIHCICIIIMVFVDNILIVS